MMASHKDNLSNASCSWSENKAANRSLLPGIMLNVEPKIKSRDEENSISSKSEEIYDSHAFSKPSVSYKSGQGLVEKMNQLNGYTF